MSDDKPAITVDDIIDAAQRLDASSRGSVIMPFRCPCPQRFDTNLGFNIPTHVAPCTAALFFLELPVA